MISCSSGWGSVRKTLWSKRLWSKQSEDGAAINRDGETSHCVAFCAFFFFFLIHFIYFWLNWVFVAALGLSLVLASGGLLFIVGFRFLTAVASCCGAWAVGA